MTITHGSQAVASIGISVLLGLGCGCEPDVVVTLVEAPLFVSESACQLCGSDDGAGCAVVAMIPAGERMDVLGEDVSAFMCLEVRYRGTSGWLPLGPNVRHSRYHAR